MPSRELAVGDRLLTVHDAGAADGPVILHHHGTPLAGGPLAAWEQDAAARGARLVCYDRPGYGGSTRVPGRTIGDAAADCAAVMDALGIERFATWGISGGAPHALACAALLGDRVSGVASLAGPAPFDARGLNYVRGMGADNIQEFGLAMAGRSYLEPVLEHQAAEMLTASTQEMTDAIATLVSSPDLLALENGIGAYWGGALAATFAAGAGGWVDDDLAFVSGYGFDLASITVPTLVVHGAEDRFVDVDHGAWLAAAIPGAERWILPEEGHLSLMTNQVPAVHEWLLERA